ncbi:cytochrome c peroxidase [Serpentinimonas raichei]|uniref:Cytochrome c peroxidase n=1 Tax=Serpentinimonas raichei TaxID=1458425 RepID=A0A060NJF4_9BURK|nr:cytochrome-c peroxidase [Serpentinimonas raichei]BAO81265.1 cytochrome c peroxidase [Serpentinimonas raichei]
MKIKAIAAAVALAAAGYAVASSPAPARTGPAATPTAAPAAAAARGAAPAAAPAPTRAAVPPIPAAPAGADDPFRHLFAPIQPPQSINIGKANLGKMMFFEPRLSRSGFISCNSCHNVSRGGSDNLRVSIGDRWQAGTLNSPTVFNAALNIAQFWDGRAATLQAQAGGPIANPVEMAFTHELAIDMLESIPEYVRQFRLVFGQERITMEQVTATLAEFQKTLLTPNSRFDQWLLGDTTALNANELAGYRLFNQAGCMACHNGVNLGGNAFQKMGVVEPYHSLAGASAVGRAAVTGKDADRFNFKVPTLRNVDMTYPYFHDGAANTLTEAVDVMGRLQLGRRFSDQENAQIVAFLKTLTGDQPAFTIPHLPPSSDRTPRPNPFN